VNKIDFKIELVKLTLLRILFVLLSPPHWLTSLINHFHIIAPPVPQQSYAPMKSPFDALAKKEITDCSAFYRVLGLKDLISFQKKEVRGYWLLLTSYRI
jgi:hypothetical protein